MILNKHREDRESTERESKTQRRKINNTKDKKN